MTRTKKDSKLVETVWARQQAAEAFAAGLQLGDLLTPEEADDIKLFRQHLAGALAKRGMQLNEEPEGWRVVRSPFAVEHGGLQLVRQHYGDGASVGA